ncbi:MAG: SDR family NAD(P)-dependent oxidoreductase [Agriterribacter sp.]
MSNKTAIVSGATGNMGQAVVKKFLSENFTVIGTIAPGDHVKMDIANEKLETAEVDLMSEENAQEFVASVIKKHGSIDAAILTVGGFAMGSIAQTTTKDILKQYQLNFETAYNTARPIFQQMLQQGDGRIFIIGSRPGLDMKFGKGMVAYSLAKSLIFRLAELMNDEAKGKNVVTSVIVPSTIDTPQNRKSMPGVDAAKWVKPEAIADVLYFYCSDEAATLREPVIKIYNNA